MRHIKDPAVRSFKGLKRALNSICSIHTFTMDLGYALGLMRQCNTSEIEFFVDGSGYRPAKLTQEEWIDIADSCKFCVIPRYRKGGVFHSKAWHFKKCLLLGSSNLSIREARENLNFWCWLPQFKPDRVKGKSMESQSFTLYWDLTQSKPEIKGTPLKALKNALTGIQLSSMVIVTPQAPSKKLLTAIDPYLAIKGNCLFFLTSANHGLDTIRRRRKWEVRNFIPNDKSTGLHGKAFYGEWDNKWKSGAVLYIGSANFTEAAYKGKNTETGILIKATGEKQTTSLRHALSSLLGKVLPVSKRENAWATERFDGKWKQIEGQGRELDENKNSFLDKEDIARSKFLDGLRAKSHCLYFPATYGGKAISMAQLDLGNHITRYWKKPSRRKIAGVVWSPEANLRISLKGRQNVIISLPPLNGLMDGKEKGTELLGLLFNPATSSGTNEHSGKVKEYGSLSLYSDPRVMVPWRNFVDKNKSYLFYDKRELTQAIKTIRSILGEPGRKQDEAIRRKLKNFAFCLESLHENRL